MENDWRNFLIYIEPPLEFRNKASVHIISIHIRHERPGGGTFKGPFPVFEYETERL